MGAAHGMELGFVFDRLGSPDALALGGPDGPQVLADAMHRAWVSFVAYGDPGWERLVFARARRRCSTPTAGRIVHDLRADELAALPPER